VDAADPRWTDNRFFSIRTPVLGGGRFENDRIVVDVQGGVVSVVASEFWNEIHDRGDRACSPRWEGHMATASVISNDGALPSASAVLLVVASNQDYNQPALRIDQAGRGGGAASIKINDPNPDIEFVETDQTPPAGKYEIAVQSDKLQINGRNDTDTAFETIVVFQRLAAGGNIGVRTTSQFGGGKGVIAIANATLSPSVNPAGGGVLYVEDGALKYRGPQGTVTTIAPA
jgi:hypothetical protein